jgi:hypothetical protein
VASYDPAQGSDGPQPGNGSSGQIPIIIYKAGLIGLGAWVACALVDAARPPALDEALVLRFVRRCAEHPLRLMTAGALLS